MSRAYDLVVSGTIIAVSVVVHLIAINLFAPDKPLWDLATEGTEAMNGVANASLWFEFLAVWMPLLGVFLAFTWPLVREYRRRVQTAARSPR